MIKAKKDNRIRLENAFRQWKRGSFMSLPELREVLDEDTGADGNHSESEAYRIALRSAKFIESETNGHLVIRWDRERNVWRALEAQEIPSESDHAIRMIRKRSRSTARMCQAAITDGLQGKERDACVAHMALANALYAFSNRQVVKQTVQMANQGVNTLTVDAALAALQNRSS